MGCVLEPCRQGPAVLFIVACLRDVEAIVARLPYPHLQVVREPMSVLTVNGKDSNVRGAQLRNEPGNEVIV